jgi:hypothetical protein
MGAALVWVLVGGFLFLSFVTSAAPCSSFGPRRSAGGRTTRSTPGSGRESGGTKPAARWLARGTGLRDLPPTGTHHRIA